MTGLAGDSLTQLQNLLAEQATVGLTDSSHAELQRLLVNHPDVDPEGFDQAAAALDLSLAPPPKENLPVSVRAKVVASGPGMAAPEEYGLSDDLPASKSVARREAAAAAERAAQGSVEARPESVSRITWLVAIAIAVAAVLIAYSSGFRQSDPSAAADSIRWTWTAKDPALFEAGGDVAFSVARQEGVMRLRGMPRLDPAQATYQLWIFDARREGPPVDGGLFSVSGRPGDEVVSFKPKLSVRMPVAFMVTREPPGGVVDTRHKDSPLMVAHRGN